MFFLGDKMEIINDEKLYQLNKYRFELPENLIAQYPLEKRDQSKLLVLDKNTGKIKDDFFYNINNYLQAGDTLVLNNSRVIPARLYAYKETGAKVEIFLLKKKDANRWEALLRPAKRLKKGAKVYFSSDKSMPCDNSPSVCANNQVCAEVLEDLDYPGGRLIEFTGAGDLDSFIKEMGHMPLPPYINRTDNSMDRASYQTVYASENGSVAAPTAGLHFTNELLKKIKDHGINIAYITLHVGIGTFSPVQNEDIRDHNMHYEYYDVDARTAELLNTTRQRGKRIIAVGTTVVRTLESIYNKDCGFLPACGETNKYIFPGYEFKAIDSMISNFHLPASSLIMLVAAFAGYENTMQVYKHAVENNYRFFSYGDAMIVI